jgi:hypothetical protein
MASLNQIVSLLAERVNRTFDVPFQEEVKVMVSYWRARIVKNSLKKHPKNRKYMQQSFVAELEEVPKVECPVQYGCAVRTKCKIPKTIAIDGMLFDYLGVATMDKAFSYVQDEFEQFMSASPYTGKNVRYAFRDGYVYIYNAPKLKYIGVRGIFENPTKILDCSCNDDCYSDDDEYPLSEDLLQEVIKSILSTELRSYMPEEDVEVKVNKDAPNRG